MYKNAKLFVSLDFMEGIAKLFSLIIFFMTTNI